MRARSNSPARESLSILNRHHAFFPLMFPLPVKETGITGLESLEDICDEDEDLAEIKKQYCLMLDEAEDVGEESPRIQAIKGIECNNNSLF